MSSASQPLDKVSDPAPTSCDREQDSELEPPPFGPVQVGTPRRRWGRRPADESEIRAMASSLRLQILRLTLHEPRTNQEIATALGRNPASVLHHVRTLVSTGFLVPQEVRRGSRGSREVPYLASGKSWYLDAPPGGSELLDAFLDEMGRRSPSQVYTKRLGFQLAPAAHEDFLRRLHALLAEAADSPSDPAGKPWSLFLAVHPEGDEDVGPDVRAGVEPP